MAAFVAVVAPAGFPASALRISVKSFKKLLAESPPRLYTYADAHETLSAGRCFAAAALLYECLPRKVEVKVISTGVGYGGSIGGKMHVTDNYLMTDHGKIDVGAGGLAKFHLPVDRAVGLDIPQKVTCVWSRDLLRNGHLHDCKPR